MSHFALMFVLIAAVLGQAPSAEPPPGLDPPQGEAPAVPRLFETDFATALARAKTDGKVLFIEFFSPKCTYCARMSLQVYPQPEVRALAEKFVWLRLDQTQGEGARLRQRFQTGATPTYLALGHDGTSVYYRFSGALGAKGFVHNLSLLPVSRDECRRIQNDESPDRTVAQRLTLAKGELMNGNLEAAKSALQQIAEQDEGNEFGMTDDALVLLGLVKIAESPKYGPWQAYVDWERVIKQYTNADRAPDAAMHIAKMLRDSGDRVKYPKLSDQIRDYPAGVNVAECAKILDEK